MSKRGRRFRLGRHWVTDEKTGFAEWDDNIVHDWDGVVTRKGLEDGEHPQWRIRALQDPYPVGLIRPERGINIDKVCGFFRMEYIPRTTIKRITSIQDDLLDLPGIGQMSIGNAADECGYWFVIGGSEGTELSFPSIINTNTSNNLPSMTHTVNLPDGISTGNRVLVCVSAENSVSFSWPAGWAEVISESVFNVSLSVGYRDIDGTEGFTGTDDIITVATDNQEASSHISYLISNFDSSSVPDVSLPTTGTNTTPDPGEVQPLGGQQSYLIIAVEAHNTASTDTTSEPIGYTDLIKSGG